jgi:hypothetical protein
MTSTDLVHVDGSSAVSATLELVAPLYDFAQRISKAKGFVPEAYEDNPETLLACFVAGAELGLTPMTAMAEIHIVKGRPGMSAKLMRALVEARGHELWVEESSDTKCTVAGRRKGSEHVSRVSWTIDQAKRARLDGAGWRLYPADMLLARASARLCRIIAADAITAVPYSIEELRDGYDVDSEEGVELPSRPGDAPPPPKKTATRKTKSRVKKDDPPAPVDAPLPPLPEEEVTKSTEERRAQMLAIRCEEVGLGDRDTRLAFYSAVCGREIASGKDVTSEDCDRLVVTLDQMKAGDVSWSALEGRLIEHVAEAEIVDPDDEEDERDPGRPFTEEDQTLPLYDPEDPTTWRAKEWGEFCDGSKVKRALAVKRARDKANELGVPVPSGIGAFGGDGELAEFMVEWISNGGKDPE